MSSVTFSTAIGGDGSTVTDDDNATTGLRNGGWRTRFVPCFTQQVAIAEALTNRTLTLSDTSATSLAIGTGSKTLTTAKFYTFAVGQWVVIASTATPSNYMYGQVTAYNSSTGSLTVNVTVVSGSGTVASWSISCSVASAAHVLKTGDTMTGDLVVPSLNGGQLAGMRNRIINGGCAVSQRSAVSISTTPQYGQCDRHIGYISGGTGISGTISQNPNSLFVGGNAFWLASVGYTTGTWVFQQRIEATNCQDLSGKTVTVSFKIAHDFGTSRSVTVSLAKANAKDNFGTVTAISTPVTTTAIASNISSVTSIVCQFALGATDAANGILLQINDSSATTVSAKNVLIGDIQLEAGATATPFEIRLYGTELALCKRYFEFFYNAWNGNSTATAIYYGLTSFSVEKRASPTLASVVQAGLGNGGFGTRTSAGSGTLAAVIQATASGAINSAGWDDSWSASAEL